jgi:hypothetical protein
MEILETVASFLMMPSDTLHPIFSLSKISAFPPSMCQELCMICLSSALFSNYSHPPISLSSFLYHISVLIMIVPTRLLHGASSFHLSLLPRQFMFQSSMF